MIWSLGFLIIAALVVAYPYIREDRKTPMDAVIQSQAPGNFVQLSRGLTHYQWFGPVRGPVAVCLHGLTTPSFVWGPIAEGLSGMGFRVLVYDLYGRGFSDRPTGPQDSAFFVTQLEELLEALDIEGDITLLGYSMGGAIVTAFSALFPEKLRQMVLLAPAGTGHDLGPMARLLTHSPVFGSWLLMALYDRNFRQSTESERTLPSKVPGIVDLQLAELQYRGFTPAVLASLRGMLAEDLEEAHKDIAQFGVPVMAIWARDDEIIPIAGKDTLMQWNPDARQVVIEQAGHGLTYTHPDAVMHAMRDLMCD